MNLPPLTDKQQSELAAILYRVPEDMQEDAIQEAWVAHLEGADPAKAVNKWRMSELRFRERHVTLPGNM